jgi:hypothetical protein
LRGVQPSVLMIPNPVKEETEYAESIKEDAKNGWALT